jgi:hypothetical protein
MRDVAADEHPGVLGGLHSSRVFADETERGAMLLLVKEGYLGVDIL